MAKKNLKKWSISLVIREIQIKTTLRFHLPPFKRLKSKTQVTADACENVEKEEHSTIVDRIENWYSYAEKQSDSS